MISQIKNYTFSILVLIFSWTLLQPFPYGGFKYVENVSTFTTDFIVNYYRNSDFNYTSLVDVEYPKYLQPLHKNLLFLHEKK